MRINTGPFPSTPFQPRLRSSRIRLTMISWMWRARRHRTDGRRPFSGSSLRTAWGRTRAWGHDGGMMGAWGFAFSLPPFPSTGAPRFRLNSKRKYDCDTGNPGFPFCRPGQHRLYIQPLPVEPFVSLLPSRAAPAAGEGGQLCFARARKTRKCPVAEQVVRVRPDLNAPAVAPGEALHHRHVHVVHQIPPERVLSRARDKPPRPASEYCAQPTLPPASPTPNARTCFPLCRTLAPSHGLFPLAAESARSARSPCPRRFPSCRASRSR